MKIDTRRSLAGTINGWSLLFVLFVCFLFALMLGVPLWNQSLQKVHERSSAPFGVLGLSQAERPEPMLIEKHFGGDWVVARATNKWATVIYYPSHVNVSVRLVPAGESTRGLPMGSGLFFYEVDAKGTTDFYPHTSVTDVFRMGPFLDDNPIFVGIEPKKIQEMVEEIKRRKAKP